MAATNGGFWFWGSIGLVVAGNVAYHLGLKQVPRTVHPLAPLVVLFATAALTTLVAFPLVARGLSLSGELRKLDWTPFVVGVGIVAIELGFLLAYRSGWKISTASLSANLVIACLLVAIGALAYGESLTPGRVGGLTQCAAYLPGPGEISLVDNEEIGDLDDPRLVGLHLRGGGYGLRFSSRPVAEPASALLAGVGLFSLPFLRRFSWRGTSVLPPAKSPQFD